MDTLKDIASITQSLTTILAIFVSGFWGYWLFIKNRQQYPRVKLSHSIFNISLEGGKTLVHLTVIIQNIGDILLSLRGVETRIHQVIPLPEPVTASVSIDINPVLSGATKINMWTELGRHRCDYQKDLFEVEPGEIQEIHHDFIIADRVKTILVYSFLQNVRKRNRDIGWDLTTFHNL